MILYAFPLVRSFGKLLIYDVRGNFRTRWRLVVGCITRCVQLATLIRGYCVAAAAPHRWPLGQRRFLFRHPFSKDLPRSICHRWVFICYDVDMIHGSSSVVVGTCFEQAVEAAVAGSGTPATTKPRRTNGGSGGEVLLFAS